MKKDIGLIIDNGRRYKTVELSRRYTKIGLGETVKGKYSLIMPVAMDLMQLELQKQVQNLLLE